MDFFVCVFFFKNINLIADEKNQGAPSPVLKLTESSIVIEGDSIESILDRKLRAAGNALISKGNQSITADFIEYDQISEQLYAKGQITITTPNLELRGTELEMSLAENTGSIANGSFVANINEIARKQINS